MREIKFRAWDKKREERYGEGDLNSLTRYGFQRFGECYYQGHIPMEDLKDIVVMQYTGMKDRNGKEIYEGDIVAPDHLDENVVVEYIPSLLGYRGRRKCGTFWDLQNAKEVVGNIYKNPALLDNE